MTWINVCLTPELEFSHWGKVFQVGERAEGKIEKLELAEMFMELSAGMHGKSTDNE